MYQHPHFYHVTNEYLLLKNSIFHDFGILDLRTTEPFRSDSRTFFSNLRTFGLKNLRTREPSNLRTFGLIGCNRHSQSPRQFRPSPRTVAQSMPSSTPRPSAPYINRCTGISSSTVDNQHELLSPISTYD